MCTKIVLSLAALTIIVPMISNAEVNILLSELGGACRVISVGDWKAPELPVHNFWDALVLSFPISSDYEFQVRAGELLLAFVAFPRGYPTDPPPVFSLDRYTIDTATGNVKRESREKWAHSDDRRPVRQSPWEWTGERMEDLDRLTYAHRDFFRTAGKWPMLPENVGRLSPDHRLLAVNSWNGSEPQADGDLVTILRPGRPADGNLNVDIFDVASGARILRLTGHFSGNTIPEQLFRGSGWMSDKYFFLPLDEVHWNKFVLCDIGRLQQNGRISNDR